uniref:WAP domain-containing protein n=1 Tax=Bos indicus x Bos taurus TaxID=30522 RepID=A0A4W2BQT5_BOBOX
MKTGTVFVLLAFLVMGDCATRQTPSCVSGQRKPGFCPEVPKGTVGICAELCSGDYSCPGRAKCCSNGCGHVCKAAVFKVSTNQARAGQGVHPTLKWTLLTCPPHGRVWKTPREGGWKHGQKTAGPHYLRPHPKRGALSQDNTDRFS